MKTTPRIDNIQDNLISIPCRSCSKIIHRTRHGGSKIFFDDVQLKNPHACIGDIYHRLDNIERKIESILDVLIDIREHAGLSS